MATLRDFDKFFEHQFSPDRGPKIEVAACECIAEIRRLARENEEAHRRIDVLVALLSVAP